MSSEFLFAAAKSDGDGSAIAGFLIISFLLWLIYKAGSGGPPSYDISGRITPR